MLPHVTRKADITIVGPGRLGTALITELRAAGYRVPQIIRRDTKKGKSPVNTDVVWFCVPDRNIAGAARKLAPLTDWKGKTAFHSSGALTSDELNVLRRRGATVAAVHPLMTFVRKSTPSLKGVPFGVEGDAAAVRIAKRIIRDLGGEPFLVPKAAKPAYHAWGAFASPLLVAALVTAEQVARAAGLSPSAARKKMLPIIRQTVDNYARLGPAEAFSGPIVRGDVTTVRKHMQILKSMPEARDVYVALARAALRHLPARNRKGLDSALRRLA